MKLLAIMAATLSLASAGQVFNQVPAEVYQALDYQQPQDQNGWQAIDGGYQGQQFVQTVQDQPIQHQHIQVAQPQQYQSHQQHQIQSQLQHLQSQQENANFQHQPQHVQIQPQHVQVQPQHVQFDQNSQIGQIDHSRQQNQYSGVNELNRQARILSYQHDSDGHNYQYAFETENGIKAQEVGSNAGDGSKTQGAYSYTGDDGRVYTVTYTADENGFHPSGEHLPTPPPVPEAIARSVENNLRDEANGVVDDGQYHEQQQQEQYTLQSQQHQQKQAPPQGLLQQVQRHNYEQTQQANNVDVKVKQQKQEASQRHQQRQQQQEVRVPHTKQEEPQKVIVHQVLQQQEPQIVHQTVQELQQIHQQQLLQQQLLQQQIQQQQLPQKMYLRFQRQQKPARPQTQVTVVKSVEPQAAVHGQVQYAIPASALATLRALRTDDYVGPAPAPVAAPVTEHQY